MIGRRQFLQFGPATLTGAMALNWRSAMSGFDNLGTYVLGRGIFDKRYPASREFAQALAAHGMRTTALKGDVGQLWYGDLREHLRRARTPIAGLTDRSTLFCLEELARDVGMRVTTRIDHLIDHDGNANHALAGTSPIADSMQNLAANDSFGQFAAQLVMQNEAHQTSGPAAIKHSGPSVTADTTQLVTWVIA